MGYPAELEEVDVVFDGPPSPQGGGCHSPHFVEVEDMQGRSLRLGKWIEKADGSWALRIEVNAGKIEGRS